MDWRSDATRYIWIVYGIAQAVVSMLMAFDVVNGTTLIESVTAVALVLYVAANELLVRPERRSSTRAKALGAGLAPGAPTSAVERRGEVPA
jgi:hypothetical protein